MFHETWNFFIDIDDIGGRYRREAAEIPDLSRGYGQPSEEELSDEDDRANLIKNDIDISEENFKNKFAKDKIMKNVSMIFINTYWINKKFIRIEMVLVLNLIWNLIYILRKNISKAS